ncbi:TauD/TfdA family dioxygenase [Actinomycetia phage DSL-LC01]|nr:TauD/TfdA family dioxygenase [Actinomycetia phage DSL-LC01]
MEIELIKHLDIGSIPPTPLIPNRAEEVIPDAYNVLYAHTQRYGTMIGYKQEQRGARVQHLLPNPKTEYGQISTSSKVELELHTETAFHPYKPDHLFLLCVRGDPTAFTTFARVNRIVDRILYKYDDEDAIEQLQLANFQTSLDDSFMADGSPDATIIMPILRMVADPRRSDYPWEMSFDSFLMKGLTPGAARALDVLRQAVSESVEEIALEAGDLLVINNHTVVHGRKPFQARYDGTDRWILRAMTRERLPARGHFDHENFVITTTFGNKHV